jgi:hypothetical protein
MLKENEETEFELELMLKYLMQSEWFDYFSDETLSFLGTEVYDLSQQDFGQAEKDYYKWKDERITYLLAHFKPVPWATFLFQAFIFYFFASPQALMQLD